MEELAVRLTERGFAVTVYCRSARDASGAGREWRGARLVVLPTLRTKYLERRSTPPLLPARPARAVRRGADGQFGQCPVRADPAPLRSAGGPARGRHREAARQWGPVGRAVYALSERLACVIPDALVTDAKVIRRHYLERYGASRCRSPTGSTRGRRARPNPGAARAQHRRYFLYVSRFEPETNRTGGGRYRLVGGDLPLVLVGGALAGLSSSPAYPGRRPAHPLPRGDLWRGVPRADVALTTSGHDGRRRRNAPRRS